MSSTSKITPLFTCLISLALMVVVSSCNKEEEVVVPPGPPDSYIVQCVAAMQVDSIKAYVQWLQNYTTRFFLAPNHRQIAFDLKRKFESFGYTDVRIDSFFVSAWWNNQDYTSWQYNAVARLAGNVTPQNIYVMGAHYDCIVEEGDPFVVAPGANDNASGVAGVLEVARIMKKQGFVPKSTIEFVAFASEEYDLNGSGEYAGKAKNSGTNIVMMLNNDMIAYSPGISEPDGGRPVNVMDYSNSGDLRTLFVTCGTTYTDLAFTHDNTYSEDGDSYSFYNNGFKALFIISDKEDNFYHTANDLFGNYNFYYCRDVSAVSCALLVQENK